MNKRALEEARRLSAATNAGVVLIRVADSPSGLRSMKTPAGYELQQDLLDDTTIDRIIAAELQDSRTELADEAARMRTAGVHDVLGAVEQGEPGEAISAAVTTHGCDIVVMSTQGRGRPDASARLLGSVADHVLRHVGAATVMVVPPPDEVSL
jgi:nucleotide-binding universal stress UspA family protein